MNACFQSIWAKNRKIEYFSFWFWKNKNRSSLTLIFTILQFFALCVRSVLMTLDYQKNLLYQHFESTKTKNNNRTSITEKINFRIQYLRGLCIVYRWMVLGIFGIRLAINSCSMQSIIIDGALSNAIVWTQIFFKMTFYSLCELNLYLVKTRAIMSINLSNTVTQCIHHT